ncbi:MAG: type II toxin-antitoxin system VapC family toxin [Vicinamibacteria bacterium]|nr:type II toxin-antitoxin system VapC family toxin [Vicinamibacteria bacterium]
MKGLDTNVIVRYMVQDDPGQSAVASRFIERECSEDNAGFINRIVLCELVWVLDSVYGYSRRQVADAIERILRINVFCVEDIDAAWCALRAYREGRADFADHLIAEVNRRAGCESTVTFEKAANDVEGFKRLG